VTQTTLVDVEHALTRKKIRRISSECYVKRAHVQCVGVAIRKISFVKEHCLETDVRSASRGMYAMERLEVLRRPSVGVDSILVRSCLSLSTAPVPQLQLWHLYWLVSVQSVGNLQPHEPYVLHFLSPGDSAPIVETS
jgi:hypothetical protein